MGLYDTIYLKDLKIKRSLLPKNLGELSLKEIQEAEYQTKDLGETFNGHFYFKKNKKSVDLYKHDIQYKWIEGDEKSKSFMDRLGYMEEVDSEELLIEDIGTNTIYVYNYFSKENHDYWVEFALIFIDNKFHKIELYEFREESNEERKIKNVELQEMMKKTAEFNNSLIGRVVNFIRGIYYKTLVKIQLFVGSLFVKIGNFIKFKRLL